MDIKLFLPMGLMISVMIALIFPAQVGLEDPLGLDEIRAQKFNDTKNFGGGVGQYYTNGSTGFFTQDGVLKRLDGDVVNATNRQQQGDQTVLTETGFGFLDYIRVIGNAIQSIFVFLTIPLLLFFNMSYPYNMVSLIYALLYMASIFAFLLGR